MGLQRTMTAQLTNIRENIDHAPTKGDGSEQTWLTFLQGHLPKRYSIAQAHVIDHLGAISDAIDLVIYDAQYTPFVFNDNGILYIPAESVYAAFEAKQEIDKHKLDYAGQKIASVRRLVRTTTTFIDRGLLKPASPLFRIMGGFLCLDNGWSTSIGSSREFKNHIVPKDENHLIDIGCVLNDRSFKTELDVTDPVNPAVKIHFSEKQETLIYFFLNLVAELQRLGTVRPIDLNQYISQLQSKS